MTLARFSHLEEVPELGQSEVTGIVQVRRLEEPELKDVIWWCGNHLKAIILCDYVISILFCKYVYHHKYIYINIFNMIISYQKLTMDFVVDLLLIFAWVLQAFHLAPPFWIFLMQLCVVEWIAAWCTFKVEDRKCSTYWMDGKDLATKAFHRTTGIIKRNLIPCKETPLIGQGAPSPWRSKLNPLCWRSSFGNHLSLDRHSGCPPRIACLHMLALWLLTVTVLTMTNTHSSPGHGFEQMEVSWNWGTPK